jgi:hypothetical protein
MPSFVVTIVQPSAFPRKLQPSLLRVTVVESGKISTVMSGPNETTTTPSRRLDLVAIHTVKARDGEMHLLLGKAANNQSAAGTLGCEQ